jgi:hypothetical protein
VMRSGAFSALRRDPWGVHRDPLQSPRCFRITRE